MKTFPEFPGGSLPHTVAIDFDDTLSKSNWPSPVPGPAIELGVDAVLFYFAQGLEIVIYTARPKSHERLVWSWLAEHGLANAIHDIVFDKPRAWLYIDDRAWNPTDTFEPPSLAEDELALERRADDLNSDEWTVMN